MNLNSSYIGNQLPDRVSESIESILPNQILVYAHCTSNVLVTANKHVT